MIKKTLTIFLILFVAWTTNNLQSQQLQTRKNNVYFTRSQSVVIRLHPNQDIMETITNELSPFKFNALSISTAVGSVTHCWLRFANNSFLSYVSGPLQITSLTGTFDKKMQPHVHIQLANGKGESFGGHLPSLDERQSKINQQINSAPEWNCPIYTTLEMVLLSHHDIIFERKIDPETTFHQLFISKKIHII